MNVHFTFFYFERVELDALLTADVKDAKMYLGEKKVRFSSMYKLRFLYLFA